MNICDYNSFFRRLIVLLHNSRGGLRNWKPFSFFFFPNNTLQSIYFYYAKQKLPSFWASNLFQNSHPLNQEQSSMVHGLSLWTSEWTLIWQSHTFYFAIDHCISRKRTYRMIAKKKKKKQSKQSPFKLLKWNNLYMKYRINNQIHK